ncbi:MAG: hypothetical protein NC253_02905 [Ruminococcus sp.]|nr:hypothetical protein [Ruminococcus sp.]MCM1380344.1 hypothetical protein [Muribaculaceae bacterium]MCM1478346.1 hypothetical protein [Muribaculaceae bacterium]
MASKYGYMATIGADTSGLTSALQTVDAEARKISSEIRDINKNLKFEDGGTVAMQQKYELLQQAITQTSQKLEMLRQAEADVNAAAANGTISEANQRSFQRELDSTANRLARYQSELESVRSALDGVENSAEGTAESVKGLSDVDVSGFSGKLNAVATAAKAGAAAVAAVGTAAVAAGTAIIKATSDTAAYADNIDKASQKLGVSAEFYQEWEAVLQHSGTSMSSMSATFKTLANAAQDMSADQQAAFEKLGISINDVANLSTEDLFEQVISGLQNMEEGTERTAIATDLLGRGAMEMGALLNTSAEDTQKMIDTVHDLGGVMSDEAIKAGAAFQDSLQDLKTSLSGLKNNLAAEFLPAMVEAMDGLAAVFSGDSSGIEKAKEGIQNFIDELSEELPVVADFGGEIITALLEGISDNLGGITGVAVDIIGELVTKIINLAPTLVDSAVEIINQLFEFLDENAYVIADGAVSIITSLVNGISDLLPKLIPTAVEIIKQIALGITDNTGELVAAALQLVISLGTGLISALPQLYEAAVELPIAIAKSLIDFDWASVAKQTMNGIVDAFDNAGKQFQVWLDNTFSGGTVYGGDVANVGSVEWIEDTRKNIDSMFADTVAARETAAETLSEPLTASVEINVSEGNGGENPAETLGETVEEYEERLQNYLNILTDGVDKGNIDTDKYFSMLENRLKADGNTQSELYKQQLKRVEDYNKKKQEEAEKAAEKEQKAEEKRQKEAQKALEDAEKERVNAIKASWDRITAMHDRGEIDDEAEYKAKAQIVKEYCDENESTWDSYYKWLYDYSAKKEKEIAKERLEAWEDSSKELTDTLAKSYSDLKKQKEQVKKDLESISLAETVKDKDGNEILGIKDLKDEIKKIDDLKAARDRLKETGISDTLLAEIDSMSFEDGSRQAYIDELLKLPEDKLQAYYADWEDLQKTREEYANDTIADQLDELNKDTLDGVKEIFGDMPAEAYDEGVETARQYLQGIIDNMDGLGNSAAVSNILNTADAAATVKNPEANVLQKMIAGGKLISSSTPININLNDNKYIKTTIENLINSGKRTGGNAFYS